MCKETDRQRFRERIKETQREQAVSQKKSL